MQPRTNRQILDAAKNIIGAVAAQVHSSEGRYPAVRELANHLLTSDDRRIPDRILDRYQLIGHPDRPEIMASAADDAIYRLWARSKVVYAMHDDLLHYLSQSSPSRIPTSVLRNLPHPNPHVILPQPDLGEPDTDYYRRHIGVPLGAFVFGRYSDAWQLCSTADDKREDLGLMFVAFIEADHGPILQTLRCTIPLGAPTFTVEDAVRATIARFRFSSDLVEDDPVKLEAWLRQYVALAFNSLLYVCTDQPDISVNHRAAARTRTATRKKARRRPRPDDIDTLVTLGFRLGPALHNAQVRYARQHHQEHGTGTTGQAKRPHQKKGHYRTYWTGPGGKVPIVKWIAPFWVNQHLLTEPTDVVIRPVKKRP